MTWYSLNRLLDIRRSSRHLKVSMSAMKALKDCGILRYRGRRAGRRRIRTVDLSNRISTESFFPLHCTVPKVSMLITWLLFRNSHYGCQLVYARGEISLDYAVWMQCSAAFDTVNHEILVNRLQNKVELQGTVLNWFKRFWTGSNFFCLTNRSQRVSINGTLPGCFNLNCGVPQGSYLGPPLFIHPSYLTL